MLERRRHPRHSAASLGGWRTAKIQVSGRAPIECALDNISWGGACLLVSNPADVPDAFDLIIELNGARESCCVIWRGQKKIGVAFTEIERGRDELGNQGTILGSSVVRDLLTFKARYRSLGRRLQALARLFGH
jgi:hypothetical protein